MRCSTAASRQTTAASQARPAREPGWSRCRSRGQQGPLSQTRASPAPPNISPATFTGWSSTTTTRRPPVPRCAATLSSRTTHNGVVPSVSLDRFQSFASTANGDEVQILRLPSCATTCWTGRWAARTSIGVWVLTGYLNRSEPNFHARNVGRLDFYPHLSLPLEWRRMELVRRGRAARHGLHHQPDSRPHPLPTAAFLPSATTRSTALDLEASVDIRPPALERDFELPVWHRELRHVIEPELTYRLRRAESARRRAMCCFRYHRHRDRRERSRFLADAAVLSAPTDEQPCASR